MPAAGPQKGRPSRRFSFNTPVPTTFDRRGVYGIPRPVPTLRRPTESLRRPQPTQRRPQPGRRVR